MSRPIVHARYLGRSLRRHLPGGLRPFRGRDALAPETYGGTLGVDLELDSGALLIAFGGLPGSERGVPAFEFMAVTAGLHAKRIFVRDVCAAWYHHGIPGQSSCITGVAESLARLVGQLSPTRLVLAGNSAGGYAALVFGSLLAADEVLAFAPQTVLDLQLLAELGDRRWDAALTRAQSAGEFDPAWMDLRRALPARGPSATRFQVHFDASHEADSLHAERLTDLPGVSLHRHEDGAHELVRRLRDSGELDELLRSSLLLSGSDPAAAPAAAGYAG